jgi:hypothetical protein
MARSLPEDLHEDVSHRSSQATAEIASAADDE